VVGKLQSHEFLSEVRPLATGQDNVNQLLQSSRGHVLPNDFSKLSPDDQNRAFDAALRIDNPDVHGPATTDCVSCHMASKALEIAKSSDGVNGLSFLSAHDGNPNRYKAAAGVNANFGLASAGGNYQVRAFGYSSESDVIYTQGTVNGSAKVAAYINQNFIRSGLVK
jgi:hypothetical protein